MPPEVMMQNNNAYTNAAFFPTPPPASNPSASLFAASTNRNMRQIPASYQVREGQEKVQRHAQ